jgi:hypothetical protein
LFGTICVVLSRTLWRARRHSDYGLLCDISIPLLEQFFGIPNPFLEKAGEKNKNFKKKSEKKKICAFQREMPDVRCNHL